MSRNLHRSLILLSFALLALLLPTLSHGQQEGAAKPPSQEVLIDVQRARLQKIHNHPNLDPQALKEHQERIEAQEKYRVEHLGHDEMHAEMLLILFATLILSQIIILIWKQRSPRSFHNITLLGLWLIPAGFSFSWGYTRFLVFWTIFTLTNLFMIYKASRPQLEQSTPRTVYKWFFVVFSICYYIGMGSFIVMMLDLFGILAFLFDSVVVFQISITTLYYALYFGVLARDFADYCADRMASSLGYRSKDGIATRSLAPNTCAICSESLYQMVDETSMEKTIKLDCNHTFHEWCIRGWCIVGKKHTCPYCNEKVDLHKFMNNPWEVVNVQYSNLLDGLRYLLVWHPVIVLFVRSVIYFLDLK